MNAPFGVHPNDHKRAQQMLNLALREGATFLGVIIEIKRWLKLQGVCEAVIHEQIEYVQNFRPNPFRRSKLRTAWLVTWEGSAVPKQQRKRIVSILDFRYSDARILAHVEQLYADHFYSLHEKINFARKKAETLYRAECPSISGFPWGEQITCGEDPYLFARRVRNLVLHTSSGTADALAWNEIPAPKSLPRR